jgi:hypothetical protein
MSPRTPQPRQLVQRAYDAIVRPRLPRKLALCDDVVARRVRLLDQTDHWPAYERELLSSIRAHVDTGDHVVEIGGGFGVATTVAARQTGPRGRVTTYEAAAEQCALIRETIELNDVVDRVDVRRGLVGADVDVWGSPAGAETINPSELPGGDVIVVDAEGAEATIVDALTARYCVVIVEVHPELIRSDRYSAVGEHPARRLADVGDYEAELDAMGYETTRAREVDGDGGRKNVWIVTASRDA